MKKIASFTVDHTVLEPGIYISRVDGDITTYDLRMRKPNSGDLVEMPAMHSLEHLFATFVRNSPLSDKVIYFGPMGCQTGCYLLMRSVNHGENVKLIKDTLKNISEYSGTLPGAGEKECGNYRGHDLSGAILEAKNYYDIVKDWTVDMTEY